MRTELLKDGNRVAILAGNLTIDQARERLPQLDFDNVSLIDERAEDAAKQAELDAAQAAAAALYESDGFKNAAVTRKLDAVFLRFIGSYSIKASYPAKQEAMDAAVAELGVDAPANALFDAAVAALPE